MIRIIIVRVVEMQIVSWVEVIVKDLVSSKINDIYRSYKDSMWSMVYGVS